MCTLTWTPQDGGFFLAFNRDERRTRAAGLAPRELERAGVRLVAPIDGEAGGTWIAANELGLALALLNGYRYGPGDDRPAAEWRSRGHLVLEHADAASVVEVAERVARAQLSEFRPFELVAFDAHGRAGLSTWDGRRLAFRELSLGDRPLVSSAFDDDGARRERRALFLANVAADAGERDLERFHASHEPARGAYSPCMHREDAHTVSFTRVRVTARLVVLATSPASPCRAAPSTRLELERRVALRTS